MYNFIFEKGRIAYNWRRKGLVIKCCWNNLEKGQLNPEDTKWHSEG